MVRVIKLSMKCTLIRAFRGMHGRKKRSLSGGGDKGLARTCPWGAARSQCRAPLSAVLGREAG